ncbi:MAG: hypothetical protein B7Y99_04170 [Caulobacterales bacterium 32-69-10]|nr:MAG: hypothetical protein B7Y99_04170 [Caulobacterales bacterium 32-69-10]
MDYSPRLLACALAATFIAMPAAAREKPAAQVIFKGLAPEIVAPRLASECTRRRMALIRNTPERVVCRRPLAVKARSPHAANELWSFALDRLSRGRTKVVANASFEAAAPHGYALLSFSDPAPESRIAMRGFMENVRDGGFADVLSR